jgi:lysylphosphatidylglycerol synthetase-like protein (DUF2156 family)
LKKKVKMKRSRRLALTLVVIVSTVFAVIFLAPDVRYSVLDQDKTLFQSGGFSFTVGDFIGIFSLIAAATSIAVFMETVRHKK